MEITRRNKFLVGDDLLMIYSCAARVYFIIRNRVRVICYSFFRVKKTSYMLQQILALSIYYHYSKI